MFCQTCRECPQKSNDSSSFVSGCSNFKIESLKSHARSTGHIQAEEAIRAKERPMAEDSKQFLSCHWFVGSLLSPAMISHILIINLCVGFGVFP